MAQIIPALAAGNGVIHKPSEHSPRVGILIDRLIREAGFPPDLFQLALGDAAVGQAIIDAPVDIIAFTGSPMGGRKVMEAASRHLTPVLLELGGKDAAIVCADADLDRTAHGLTWGAFVNAGQTCVSVKRVIAVDAVYDALAEKLTHRIAALTPSAAPDAQLGAITLERELDRIEAQVQASVARGARLATGGKRLPGPGVFYAPTLLVDCTPDMPAVQEETFGPLLTMLRARDEEDALKLANQSHFGLAGSIWTRDEARALALAARFHTGGVAINDTCCTAGNVRLPFGGVGHSGVGRAFGELGYANYCNVQAVMSNRVPNRAELPWHPYTPFKRRLIDLVAAYYHSSWNVKFRTLMGGKS
jgi:acyl-CoA reductase-like NAD-dependent aldehyde dehydrogenase